MREDFVVTLVVAKRMSAEFREVCAVFEDGTYRFARSYEQEPWVLSELASLEMSKSIPSERRREIVDIEEIRAAWREEETVREVADEETRKLERVLRIAAEARASDLVIETDEVACRVSAIVNDRKFAIGEKWRAEEGRRVMRKLFYFKEQGSQQTSYQERAFQGFAVRDHESLHLPPRVSGLRGERGPSEPTGEHMFLRLFYSDTLEKLSLEELGFEAEQREVLERMCRTLRGAVIVGGVTGDGKSTTLATCLLLQQQLFGHSLNLVTAEDPVEVRIPGAVQLAVSTAAAGGEREQAFGSALRHFCRVNPGSGMVSEIRDVEAARQVMRFVDTGHQVWTTIHAGDANGIAFRLRDLGVPVEQVCNVGNLALLMKQTIVSVLCDECKIPATGRLPEWLVSDLGTDEVFVRNAEGCESCRRGGGVSSAAWAGYRRRRAVAEMIQPDEQYLEFVRRGEPNQAVEYWTGAMGGVPVHWRVRELVLKGEVDPEDALSKGMVLREGRRAGAEKGAARRPPGAWRGGRDPSRKGRALRANGRQVGR